RGDASDPYALHLGDGGAGTLDQGVDGPTGLRHQPLQVRDRGDAGGVEDIGTDVAEGAQPGDRVVEVVDPVEVVLGPGGEHEPRLGRGCRGRLHSFHREVEGKQTSLGVV